MAVDFDLLETVNAPKEQVMAHFIKVEDMPKFHPKMARKVEVLEKSDSAIKYTLETKVMLKKMESVNNMAIDRAGGTLITETLEGDGKGSRITMAFTEKDGRTDISLKASMELGVLGSIGKGMATSMWKEAIGEAKTVLEKK